MAWLFAFLHHAAAFALVAALAVELVLLRSELTAPNVRRLQRADMALGISAGILLVVGLLRVFYFEKGAAFHFVAADAAGYGAPARAATHRASRAGGSRGDPAVRGPHGARDRFDNNLREEQWTTRRQDFCSPGSGASTAGPSRFPGCWCASPQG